jgi:hypothetical protein
MRTRESEIPSLETLVGLELKDIKKRLKGLGGIPIQYGSIIQMKVKGQMRAKDLDGYSWRAQMDIMQEHFADQVKQIRKELKGLAGYEVDFHYSDQNARVCTMNLRRICPCCGRT